MKISDRTLTVIRGLPGSGKSTLAESLRFYGGGFATVCEADEFFMVNGEYKFDKTKLREAHNYCKELSRNTMKKGLPVIVSNTTTTFKELKPYLDQAKHYRYDVQIIDVKGNFGSIHNVPEETIDKMKQRWENITIEQVQEYMRK